MAHIDSQPGRTDDGEGDFFSIGLSPMSETDPNRPDIVLDYLMVDFDGVSVLGAYLDGTTFEEIATKVKVLLARRLIGRVKERSQAWPDQSQRETDRRKRDDKLAKQAQEWLDSTSTT